MPKLKSIIAFTFISLSFLGLLRLGFWQVERLAWKTDLLASIEQEYAKPLDNAVISAENINQIYGDLAYGTVFRGTVSGQLNTATPPQFINTSPKNGRPAYNVQLPFSLNGELDAHLNIGWIDYQDKDSVLSALSSTPSTITDLTVTLRKPPQGQKRYPYVFHAETNPIFNGITAGGHDRPTIRNKHKSYAIFWFSMAGLLLILSSAFALRGKK